MSIVVFWRSEPLLFEFSKLAKILSKAGFFYLKYFFLIFIRLCYNDSINKLNIKL
jgi:hypothetical protein